MELRCVEIIEAKVELVSRNGLTICLFLFGNHSRESILFFNTGAVVAGVVNSFFEATGTAVFIMDSFSRAFERLVAWAIAFPAGHSAVALGNCMSAGAAVVTMVWRKKLV